MHPACKQSRLLASSLEGQPRLPPPPAPTWPTACTAPPPWADAEAMAEAAAWRGAGGRRAGVGTRAQAKKAITIAGRDGKPSVIDAAPPRTPRAAPGHCRSLGSARPPTPTPGRWRRHPGGWALAQAMARAPGTGRARARARARARPPRRRPRRRRTAGGWQAADHTSRGNKLVGQSRTACDSCPQPVHASPRPLTHSAADVACACASACATDAPPARPDASAWASAGGARWSGRWWGGGEGKAGGGSAPLGTRGRTRSSRPDSSPLLRPLLAHSRASTLAIEPHPPLLAACASAWLNACPCAPPAVSACATACAAACVWSGLELAWVSACASASATGAGCEPYASAAACATACAVEPPAARPWAIA
jgi:hypothetical protein